MSPIVLYTGDMQEGALLAGPIEKLDALCQPAFHQRLMHHRMVATVDDCVHHEEHRLFKAFSGRSEVLAVSGTERGEEADGGLDDNAELLHFARLADARFEARGMFRTQLPR